MKSTPKAGKPTKKKKSVLGKKARSELNKAAAAAVMQARMGTRRAPFVSIITGVAAAREHAAFRKALRRIGGR